MIGALAALDALGAVALVVDGERVPVRVTEKTHENREIEVRAVERDGDREAGGVLVSDANDRSRDRMFDGASAAERTSAERVERATREFRVRTEWAAGWLDPIVGVRVSDDKAFCPAGRLDAVETAAVSRRGRRCEFPPRADARPWRA